MERQQIQYQVTKLLIRAILIKLRQIDDEHNNMKKEMMKQTLLCTYLLEKY